MRGLYVILANLTEVLLFAAGGAILILAAYLRPLLGLEGVEERWIAALVILAVTALNYRSLLWSSFLENAVSSVKLLLLLGLAVGLFAFGDGSSGALSEPLRVTPASWSGIIVGVPPPT